jgi:hypothetical protein
MELSKEMILERTHRGLNIYAFILRHYYPDQRVLELKGRKCEPTANPFRSDKRTLMIQEVEGAFQYHDLEDQAFVGDAFQFASLHFHLEGQELLQRLNADLGLRLENQVQHPPQEKGDAREPKSNRPILPRFSYFSAPVTNTAPLREVTLLDAYHSIKYEHAKQTATLRTITDVKAARQFKAKNFDYVTFSGAFQSRKDCDLIRHSGLLALDFDHVADVHSLKAALIRDTYFETEILFTSPSGDGLKWIVSIDITRHTHQEWFSAIKNYVRFTYQHDIDSAGKDVSRACFLPHDPHIFLHSKYHH